MRVLVVGGGGREHALVHSFAQSPLADRIFCAPGNAGTAAESDNIPIGADDTAGLLEFASREQVDLTVVGPEAPLVAGLTDAFEEHGLKVFGPSQAAAQLEGSKVFAKEVMGAGGVATGAYRRHTALEAALADVEGRDDYPLVVKADGLAAGKGVLICRDKAEARAAVEACFVSREFGDAGDVLITEEYLTGSEVSLLVLCDGRNAVPLAPAQDYKRIFAGDQGPNTGGMGSYCPVPGFEAKAIDAAMEHVVEPVVAALRKRGIAYRGVLYAGLIVTDAGVKVLEFNCRFGDPETQAVLPRLGSDLLELCAAAAVGELGGVKAAWKQQDCVTVVLASAGYPASSHKGDVISGLDEAAGMDGVTVYHAGTAFAGGVAGGGGDVVTAGGRVLAVSALGDGFAAARERAYEAAALIRFDGMQLRPDIAERAVRAQAGELDLFPAGFGRG
jgi:phosphoribosylamine--glycine ligase